MLRIKATIASTAYRIAEGELYEVLSTKKAYMLIRKREADITKPAFIAFQCKKKDLKQIFNISEELYNKIYLNL